MIDLLHIGFPMSYTILGISFLFGAVIAFLLFGFFSAVVILLFSWFGILRITPILQMVEKAISYFMKDKIDSLKKGIHSSFTWEGKVPTKPAIYLFHPHGAYCASFFFNTLTSLTRWPIEKARSVVVKYLYWLPFGEEICDSIGCVPNNYEDMKKVLDRSESLSVIPGGLLEMVGIEKGKIRCKLRRRAGVFRLALETGTPLVPVLVYGENELYELADFPIFRLIQSLCMKIGFALPIPSFKSLQKWFRMMDEGLQEPIHSVIGDILEVKQVEKVTEDDIDALRTTYIQKLRELYTKTHPAHYADEIEIL